MRYGRDENVACRDPLACEPEKAAESMADLMHGTASVGQDILKMSEIIGQHLFGLGARIQEEKSRLPDASARSLQHIERTLCMQRKSWRESALCWVRKDDWR